MESIACPNRTLALLRAKNLEKFPFHRGRCGMNSFLPFLTPALPCNGDSWVEGGEAWSECRFEILPPFLWIILKPQDAGNNKAEILK